LRVACEKKENRKLLKRIWAFLKRLLGRGDPPFGDVTAVVACFPDHPAPGGASPSILRTLAREFALCDAWFCSVPGETWPNRNFLHAGTSHGEVDIKLRFHTDRTIFEALNDNGDSARIYHDGPAQGWAFPKLWSPDQSVFRSMDQLWTDVRNRRLPAYAFVEPRHYKLFNGYTNNQHPNNNPKDGRDFLAAEKLICDIYSALIAEPTVWERTLFVVTYDEHGGLYDHEPPPYDPARFANGDHHTDGAYRFSFDVPGPRVPAVLVSPWVTRGRVDSRVYDHTSVIASLRDRFGVSLPPNNRIDRANDFWANVPGPLRPLSDVPEFRCLSHAEINMAAPAAAARGGGFGAPDLDEFQRSLLGLTTMVDQALTLLGAERLEPAEFAAAAAELPIPPTREFRSENELYEYLESVTRRVQPGLELI
jgi:phospholipase C